MTDPLIAALATEDQATLAAMVAPPDAAELQLAQRALARLLVRLPAGNRGNT